MSPFGTACVSSAPLVTVSDDTSSSVKEVIEHGKLETSLDSIVVKVPGSLVDITMLPVTRDDGSVFYMSKHEIAWDIFDIYAFSRDLSQAQQIEGVDATARPTKPYGAPDQGWGHKNYAALSMTLHSSIKFTEWLSHLTGRKFRLANEGEWIYACHASSDYSMDEDVWHRRNSDYQAHELGSKNANALGIHDMLGNVGEWVISESGENTIMGGSHETKPKDISCETREVQEAWWNDTDPQIPKSIWWLSDAYFLGVRLVMDL